MNHESIIWLRKTFRNIMPYAEIVPSHHLQIAWIRQDICSHLEAKKKNRHKCLINRKFHKVYAQLLVFSTARHQVEPNKILRTWSLCLASRVSQLVREDQNYRLYMSTSPASLSSLALQIFQTRYLFQRRIIQQQHEGKQSLSCTWHKEAEIEQP